MEQHEATGQHEPEPALRVLEPSSVDTIASLQRMLGNRGMQRLLRQANPVDAQRPAGVTAPAVDLPTGANIANPGASTVTSDATLPGGWTDAGGTTTSSGTVGAIDRILLEGITGSQQAQGQLPNLTVPSGSGYASAVGTGAAGHRGRAVALVPRSVRTGAGGEIAVVVHFHGIKGGSWEMRSRGNTPLDVSSYQIPQQVEAFLSSRPGARLIVLLPIGVTTGGADGKFGVSFGISNVDTFVSDCFSALGTALPQGSTPGPVYLSAHSGGGLFLSQLLANPSRLPSRLAGLFGFESWHGDQGTWSNFVAGKMDADLVELERLRSVAPAGQSADQLAADQIRYLRERGFRFVGLGGFGGYATRVREIRSAILAWWTRRASRLSAASGGRADVLNALWANYQANFFAGSTHSNALSQDNNFGRALASLPSFGPLAPAPAAGGGAATGGAGGSGGGGGSGGAGGSGGSGAGGAGGSPDAGTGGGSTGGPRDAGLPGGLSSTDDLTPTQADRLMVLAARRHGTTIGAGVALAGVLARQAHLRVARQEHPDGGVDALDGGLPPGGLPDAGVPEGGVPDGGVPDGGSTGQVATVPDPQVATPPPPRQTTAPAAFTLEHYRISDRVIASLGRRASDVTAEVLRLAGQDPVAWYNSFTSGITFLGRRVVDPIHVRLAEHLRRVEQTFATRFGGPAHDPAVAGARLGLTEDIIGSRAFPTSASISMHMFGLAIDVNYTANPFIGKSANPVFARAGLLVNGSASAWRSGMSYAQLAALNTTLRSYFALLNDTSALQARLDAASAAPWQGKSLSQAQAIIQADLNDVTTRWERTRSTQVATIRSSGFTNLTRDFVDGIGLSWGAAYGDMMHFDMRGDGGVGQRIRGAIDTWKAQQQASAH